MLNWYDNGRFGISKRKKEKNDDLILISLVEKLSEKEHNSLESFLY